MVWGPSLFPGSASCICSRLGPKWCFVSLEHWRRPPKNLWLLASLESTYFSPYLGSWLRSSLLGNARSMRSRSIWSTFTEVDFWECGQRCLSSRSSCGFGGSTWKKEPLEDPHGVILSLPFSLHQISRANIRFSGLFRLNINFIWFHPSLYGTCTSKMEKIFGWFHWFCFCCPLFWIL